MFRSDIQNPQEELRIFPQNCQLYTRLLHKMCYKLYNILFFS